MKLGVLIRSYTLASMRSEHPTAGQRAWRAVLAAVEVGYRAGIALRAWAFVWGVRTIRRLPCPVICVGNLTVGGSGKTPCVMALADRLRARGHAVGILLRGYGRGDSGLAVVGDGREEHGSWQGVGDEAILIAQRLPGVPVVVGGNRFEAGHEALRRFRLDLLLLDDGFQHRQLHRDLDLVMLDAADPFGGGRLLPRGRLREPISALRRAHAVILSRTDQAPDLSSLRRRLQEIVPGVPVVLSRHHPSRLTELGSGRELPLAGLAGRRVLAVSGIASPEGFHRTLIDLGAGLAGTMVFPDHHSYGADDMLHVEKAAEDAAAELIVTTEKDAVRIPMVERADMPARAMLALGVDLEITEGQEALERLLTRCAGGMRG